MKPLYEVLEKREFGANDIGGESLSSLNGCSDYGNEVGLSAWQYEIDVLVTNQDGQEQQFTIVYQPEERNDGLKNYSGYDVRTAGLYGCDADQSLELEKFCDYDTTVIDALHDIAWQAAKETYQRLTTTFHIINTFNRDEEDILPVYTKHPGQHEPQNAYISITPDPDNKTVTLSVEVDGSVGTPTRTEAQFHGRELSISIAPTLTRDAIHDFLNSESFSEKVLAIASGYSCRWNGSNQVGVLTPDAIETMHDLEQLALEVSEHESNRSSVLDIREYAFEDFSFENVWPINLSLMDAMKALEEECKAAAAGDSIILNGDADDLYKRMVEVEIPHLADNEKLPMEYREALKDIGLDYDDDCFIGDPLTDTSTENNMSLR